MGLYSGGLIIGRIFVSEIWGAYFREGLVLGGVAYYRNFTAFDVFVYLIMCSVTIRGDHQDEAVLCTDKATFDLKMADTSNSLLLVPQCVLPKDEGLET